MTLSLSQKAFSGDRQKRHQVGCKEAQPFSSLSCPHYWSKKVVILQFWSRNTLKRVAILMSRCCSLALAMKNRRKWGKIFSLQYYSISDQTLNVKKLTLWYLELQAHHAFGNLHTVNFNWIFLIILASDALCLPYLYPNNHLFIFFSPACVFPEPLILTG